MIRLASGIMLCALPGCSTLFGIDERGNVTPGLIDVAAETIRNVPGYGWAVGAGLSGVALIARHYLIVRAGRKDADWDGIPDDAKRKAP